MNDILLIVIGWALGLFSPLVLDWFRKPQEARALMRAIKSEASETQYRLSCCGFLLAKQYGAPDKEYLLWAIGKLAQYDGPEKQIDTLALNAMGMLDRPQFEELWRKTSAAPETGVGLKKFPISFLDAMLPRIGELPLAFQSSVHTIIYKIYTINQQVENALEWQKMTFDSSISEENHKRIKDDIHREYTNMSRQCRLTADHIDNLLNIKEPSRFWVRTGAK